MLRDCCDWRADDVAGTVLFRCGRRKHFGPDADSGQEPLERGGLGAADASGPRAPCHGHHAVPQESAGGKLHGSGHVASNAVRRQPVLGHGHGRSFDAQQSAVSLGCSQERVSDGVRARTFLAPHQIEQVRSSFQVIIHKFTIGN